ncbi:MAG: SH3 domain-containing protein, partial [Lachnospiraceae bacterium]|nr:SH3 domain-containing protein [Lachnospiraceae bacterium]
MITRNSRLTACVLAGAVVFSTIPTQAVYATTNVNAEVKNYITGGTYSFSVGASSAINETIVLDDMTIAENESQVVAEPVSEYMNIAITQVNEYLNVRAEANEEAEVLGKLYNSGAATVLEAVGDWYKITSGSVTGYVHSNYVVVGDEELCKSVSTRTATVATEALKFRKEANTECGVYALLEEGKNLQIVEDEEVAEGWYKVTDGEDTGYVSAEYVTVERNYTHAE